MSRSLNRPHADFRRRRCAHTLRAGAKACVALLIAAVTLVAFAESGNAAAVVEATRQTQTQPVSVDSLAALKAAYRRPTFIAFPRENPYTLAKVALGKKLYFDTRLSASAAQSCASCHNPGFGWGDGLAVGVGHGMQKLARRTPTVLNSAWGATFMWDGRAVTLEEQALGPIQSPAEMNMPIERLMQRLGAIDEYAPLFAAAFPDTGLSPHSLADAIATYERTIVSGWTPFDAWIAGEENAINEQAKRGFAVFNTRGGCALCHTGWNFTDDGFHDIGLPDGDIGRGKFLQNVLKLQNAFKTPGLRDIALRSPYMHDGSLATLTDVVAHYASHGIDRPSRSELIGQIDLSVQDEADLVAFLDTLTSPHSVTAMPAMPR